MTSTTWRSASRALAAKMLAELAFEGALEVAPLGGGRYAVAVGAARYEFAGRPVAFESWRIDPKSVTRGPGVEGVAGAGGAAGRAEADPLQLLLDLHEAWGLDPAVTALTVTELSTTLVADVALLKGARPVAELADLPHHELEGYMTGHPWMVMNKGRVGFGAADVAAYAPESRRPIRLPWIAVHRSLADYRAIPSLPEQTLLARQLGPAAEAWSKDRGSSGGLYVPDLPQSLGGAGEGGAGEAEGGCGEYVWLPVHPWQWDHVVVPWFAAEIAQGLIVWLGEAPGEYLPQQSIRTFTSLTPGRLDTKLPLSILNTMVYRGIPAELVAAAPVTTQWLHDLRDGDPDLEGLVLPGEVAAVSVRHPTFDRLPDAPYRYHQLLGVIWREPLAEALAPGERARTMASLLHVDADGRAFTAELVDRSGLDAREWTARLLGVVLPPLLHLMWRHGVMLNPHGENTTVIYEADVPTRLAVKDFVDDLKLLHDVPGPAEAGALLRCTAEEMVESLTKSVFLGHFRYLAPLLEEQCALPEATFWAMVRDVVERYRSAHPDLAARFAALDLLGPTLPRVVLNRERLLPGGYHDRADRDAHFDLEAPPLRNPLHRRDGSP